MSERSSASWILGMLVGLILLGIYSFPRHPLLLPDLAQQGGYDYFYFFATTQALDAGVRDVYLSEEMARFSRELSDGRWEIRGNHPLPFYLLYTGLARLDFGTGYLVHLWLGVALYALGVVGLCLSTLPDRRLGLAMAALLAVACLVTGPGVDNLWLGQVGFVLSFALCMAFVLGVSGREVGAGVFLALAILLKLYPAVLALFYLRRGQWRVVASAAATLALSGLVAGGLWGFGHYANFLEWSAATGYRSVLSNQSLMGLLALILGEDATGPLKFLNLVLLGGAVAGMLAAGRRWGGPSREAALLEYSAWVLVSMILAPLSWAHHHLALVLPLVGFAALALRQSGHRAFGLGGVGLMAVFWLLEGEVVTRDWVRALHYQYCLYRVGLLMLLLLLAACLSGLARTRPGGDAAHKPREHAEFAKIRSPISL